MINARIYKYFLFDVTEYIKYADKRYMRDYCFAVSRGPVPDT